MNGVARRWPCHSALLTGHDRAAGHGLKCGWAKCALPVLSKSLFHHRRNCGLPLVLYDIPRPRLIILVDMTVRCFSLHLLKRAVKLKIAPGGVHHLRYTISTSLTVTADASPSQVGRDQPHKNHYPQRQLAVQHQHQQPHSPIRRKSQTPLQRQEQRVL